MKKILLLVIAVFSFIACTNEVSEKGTKSSNPCDFVGKYHNAALKYTFGHLKNATRTEISLEGQEELLFDDLTSYLSDVLSTESSFDISCYCQVDDEEEIEYAINDAMLRIGGNNLIPYSDQGLAVNSLIDSLDVSESVRTEFRDIYFGFIVYSGANLLSFIQNKENSIMLSNYTNMEKSFLLAVLAVGENSFEYWNSPGFDSGVSGKNIAKADVVGAIRGA